MSNVIVVARGNHGRRTIVLDTIRIRVDALMQLRSSTQCERPEKTYGNECCDYGASAVI